VSGELPLGARVFRRPALRALVPTAVLAVIAGSVATYRAVNNRIPTLPAISAAKLLGEMAHAGSTPFSGTVRLTTDLGLPNLPASSIQGANPVLLLAGTHTLQVASDGPNKQRVAFLASLSEYDVVRDGGDLWLYDSTSNAVTHRAVRSSSSGLDLTPSQLAARLLTLAGPQAGVTVDGSTRVAGRAAYTLSVLPNQTGTLVAEVQIAVDAATGVPLRVALYPGGSDTTPAVDATFTQISYAHPPTSTFAFTVPLDAHLTNVASGTSRGSGGVTVHTHGTHFTTVEEIDGFDVFGFSRKFLAGNAGLDPSLADLMTGSVRAFVLVVAASGTDVKGAFGGGVLYTTRMLSVLVTNDNRVYAGLVSPQVLEAAAAQPTSGGTP
jgi:outer membrane lipoprotein-sorting protein